MNIAITLMYYHDGYSRDRNIRDIPPYYTTVRSSNHYRGIRYL
ncbi:hypothetical protein D6_00194 [Faustovirus]|nr:hypothetical protein D6_00194 [Faustovirus]